MSKVYTTKEEEYLISRVISDGFGFSGNEIL